MTHIENILPEMVGGEVHRLSVDDADKLSATAIKDIVTHSTGCSLTTPDGSPTTNVEELIALCTAVLRSHWQKTLTMLDGQSLQDLIRRLIGDRVKGDDTFGIPAFTDSLSEAVSAIEDRKVSGCPEVLDGMSLVQLLCSDYANTITELVDDNTWVLRHTSSATQIGSRLKAFANLKSLTMGCTEIDNRISYQYPFIVLSGLEEINFPNLEVVTEGDNGTLYQCSSLTTARFPKLHTLYSGWNNNHNRDGLLVQCNAIKSVTLPSLVRFENRQSSGSYNCIMYNNAALEELIMPKLSELYHNTGYTTCFCVSLCPSIKKIVIGTLTEFRNVYIVDEQSTELIHIEFGQGTITDIYLHHWSPTTALTERLSEFLSNFQTYIADRVADLTGQTALTLTISAAVYEALQAQEGQTILATLTNKNWTVAQA